VVVPALKGAGVIVSRRTRIGVVWVVLAALAAVAVPLAQRGGYRGVTTRSYTGNVRYDGKFTFVRMSYESYGGRRRGAPTWAHDWPFGEENFLKILTAITNVPAHVDESSIMAFSDPELFKFPIAYLVEPGNWYMRDVEVDALRDYLVKGGFLIVDDFPDWAWGNFDLQMSRVFPEGRWIELTIDHPIFHAFFDIESLDIIPQAYWQLGGRPMFYGLFEGNDENNRMYAVANFQNDLSEFWEFVELGYAPIAGTNEAYRLGINQFIYGILH
jgi:hypothetical protein